MKITLDLTCQTCGTKWSQEAVVENGELRVEGVCPNAMNHEPEEAIIKH